MRAALRQNQLICLIFRSCGLDCGFKAQAETAYLRNPASCIFLICKFCLPSQRGKDKMCLALNGVAAHIGWQEYALACIHLDGFAVGGEL